MFYNNYGENMVENKGEIVTEELIQKLESNFQEKPKNRLAQNNVIKHGILESMISHDKIKGRVHVYNCSIPDEGKPITNQKSSGRCWIFAMLNTARVPFMKKYEISDFEFSQSYLFFWDKIERTNFMLENYISTRNEPLEGRLMAWLLSDPYCDGGQWDMLINLVKKYGVVPKHYFPEVHSSESSRHLNKILTNKIREYCHRLREMTDASIEDLRKEKEAMLNEAYQICSIALGTPPTKFDWEYKAKGSGYQCHRDLTPLSFYENFVKPVFDVESKICLINDPRPEHEYNKLYTVQYLGNMMEGYPVRYINLTVDELKQFSIKALKEGEPVWFGCDVGVHFLRKAGINDLEIFDIELTLGVSTLGLSKADRLKYGESLMTHAMVFTGVQLKNKEVPEEGSERWRVENSWGSDSGNSGYLMMTDQWFSEYVYEVVVDKRHVPQEIIDILQQDPVVLPPWDPMGALAQ